MFYRGGALIDRLRGIPDPQDDDRPEDWVGSATALGWPGRDPAEGISIVEIDGRRWLLSDLFRHDPVAMLGADHVARFGPTPAVLVKLLDAAVRLPVHSHPTRAFAREHLGSPYGKTEAWIVIDTRHLEPAPSGVLLGFRRDVSEHELLSWIREQDVARLTEAMHRLEVAPGDVIYVPAGLPHAIEAGLCIVELQEPTSLSVLIEHAGFPVDPAAAHLGLGWDIAVGAVDRAGYTRQALVDRFVRRISDEARGAIDLFGAAAAPYFGAARVRLGLGDTLSVEAGFAILIVLGGEGTLVTRVGPVALRRGDQYLTPFAMGRHELRAGAGGIDLLRCLPPSASA